MKLPSTLTTPLPPGNPAFVYGFLVVILLLLIWDVQWQLSLPPSYPYDRYGNIVVVLMLLLNHLAYQFRWPALVMAALRLFSWVWIVFAVFYFCYGSHMLFPAK
ncbi:hypothetical protein [Prosthecobacter sp.]|jgi:hypothetical protein|uniref:hypothetical protein n=1 Tax=Prosthecobacter sp. TaxID=1965333 RepID=UPI0037CA5CED